MPNSKHDDLTDNSTMELLQLAVISVNDCQMDYSDKDNYDEAYFCPRFNIA